MKEGGELEEGGKVDGVMQFWGSYWVGGCGGGVGERWRDVLGCVESRITGWARKWGETVLGELHECIEKWKGAVMCWGVVGRCGGEERWVLGRNRWGGGMLLGPE